MSPKPKNNSSNILLNVEKLNIFYGEKQAVNDVSFEINSGEIFGFLGPNGAGKTSTLSAVEGLLKPKTGKIYISGHDIQEEPMKAKANMGVQLQSTSFQPELTILEIIELYAGLYGVELSNEETMSLLRGIGLEAEAGRRFRELSGGQKQRVSLSIATIHNPLLLLLDEPTTGLDPQSRRQLWDKIESMRKEGRSILLTTHSMEEAEAVCDRIAIIDQGKIIVTDTPEGLIKKFKSDKRVKAISRKGKVTLEDVFIGLTGREIR